MQPQAVALARAPLLHHETRNDGDEHLGEDPELPHRAVVQLETQEVQAHVEAHDLDDDLPEHLLLRGARLEVDVLLIGHRPLETVGLHAYPDSLTDGEQQKEEEMVVLEPGVQKDPDAHKVGGEVERVHPQRIGSHLLLLRQVDGDDVDQKAEDNGQAHGDPCADPSVSTDAQVVDEILGSDVPARVTRNQSLKNVHKSRPTIARLSR